MGLGGGARKALEGVGEGRHVQAQVPGQFQQHGRIADAAAFDIVGLLLARQHVQAPAR